MRVFFDTNIIINNFNYEANVSKVTQQLITLCLENNIEMYTSVNSLTTFFYVTNKNLRQTMSLNNDNYNPKVANDYVWSMMDVIFNTITIVGADFSDAYGAKIYKDIHNDFEDDLIYTQIERAEADLVVSEDKQFINHCPYLCLNTQKSINYIKAKFTEE